LNGELSHTLRNIELETFLTLAALETSYEFPISINLSVALPSAAQSAKGSRKRARSSPTKSDLLAALKDNVGTLNDSRIIYSEYGSPYDCNFGTPKVVKWEELEDRSFEAEVKSTGRAVRNRDLPTAKEKTAEKEKKGGKAQAREMKNEKQEAEKEGFRVIRSHFGNSKCVACHEPIEIGEWIARKEGEDRSTRTGGWGHLACCVEH